MLSKKFQQYTVDFHIVYEISLCSYFLQIEALPSEERKEAHEV